MAAHTFSEMTKRPAPSTGGLEHYGMDCSCGYVAASTMPTLVAQYAREHLEWHKRQDANPARAALRRNVSGRVEAGEAEAIIVDTPAAQRARRGR